MQPKDRRKKGRYQDILSKHLKQLECQRAALRVQQQQKELTEIRLLLLVDFIACQEELERILQAQAELLELAEQEPTDPNTNVSSVASGTNWCNQMLASATLRQLRQVQHMTAEDWFKINRDVFAVYPTLMELADRQLAPCDPAVAPAAVTTPPAAAAAEPAPQQRTGAGAAVTVPAAGSACACSAGAAEVAADATLGSAAVVSDPADGALTRLYRQAARAIQQLEQDIMPLAMAAMFHNPQPYYVALACNQANGQVALAPPSHIKAAAKRLDLSPRQKLHLRVLHTEFGRLSQTAAQWGEALADLTAKVSLTDKSQGLEEGGAAVAAGGSSGGSSGGAGKTAAQAKAAAAAGHPGGCPGEGLSSKLQQYLHKMNLHTCVTVWGIINTLSPHQRATHVVAIYPFVGKYHAIAEYCASLELTADDSNVPELASGDGQGAAAAAARGRAEVSDSAADSQHRQFVRQLVDEHMALREAQLQQQAEGWWQQHQESTLCAGLQASPAAGAARLSPVSALQ